MESLPIFKTVEKSKDTMFYIICILLLIGTVIYGLINFYNSSCYVLVEIAFPVFCCVALLLFMIGKKNQGKIVFVITMFCHNFFLTFIQSDYFNSSSSLIFVIIVLLVLFMFEKELQKKFFFLSMFLSFFINIMLALTLKEDVVIISKEYLRAKICVSAFGIFIIVTFVYYFVQVSNQVFDEIKQYSDRIDLETKDKENFFACMSHEIRNPVHALINSLEIILPSMDRNPVNQRLAGITKACCELL